MQESGPQRLMRRILGNYSSLTRWEKYLERREHKPSLIGDIVVAGLAFVFMYASITFELPADPEWDRYYFVIAGFVCIGLLINCYFFFGGQYWK